MADPAFDPATHRLAATRWFDDLTVGERFPNPSRTMTEALFAAFTLSTTIASTATPTVTVICWPTASWSPRRPRRAPGRSRT
jgi:hypothetical protein